MVRAELETGKEGQMAETDGFVTIYETDMQARVAMVKMALQNADIPFMCVNDVVSSVLPIDGMGIVGFRVPEQDAERARQILDDLGFA
jgi:hypothetical protein